MARCGHTDQARVVAVILPPRIYPVLQNAMGRFRVGVIGVGVGLERDKVKQFVSSLARSRLGRKFRAELGPMLARCYLFSGQCLISWWLHAVPYLAEGCGSIFV